MGRLRVQVGLWVVFAVCSAALARAQLFMPSGVRFAPPTAPSIRVFQSPNHLYEVAVEEVSAPTVALGPETTFSATVLKVDGNLREKMWSTTFQGWSLRFLAQDDVFLSNKGDFLLVRRSPQNEVRLYREGKNFSFERGSYAVDGLFLSSPEDIVEADEVDGEEVVRIWDRDKNLWRAYRTLTGDPVDLKQRSDLIAKWNDAKRNELLDRIYAARREAFRRHVGGKSAPLAKIAAAAMGQNTNVVVSESDYEFLSLLRKPEDRKWVEQLMDFQDDRFGGPAAFRAGRNSSSSEAEYIQTDYVRARADWLLGIWDNKVKRGMIARQNFREPEDDLPRFTLGKVKGKIFFPSPVNLYTGNRTPTPPAWAGPAVRVRLISLERTTAKTRDWADNIDRGLWGTPDRNEDLIDEAAFAFTTVRPGRYQVKAIGDKRAPFSNFESAGPGDYESALSQPIEVTAGGVISNLVLYCTNRVTGGDAVTKAMTC